MSWILDMVSALVKARPDLDNDDVSRERYDILQEHLTITRQAEDSSRRIEGLVRELLDENMRLKVERV